MITLQIVPVDLLLNVGAYLLRNEPYCSEINDIHEITLAAILNDYDMLEYYIMEKYQRKNLTSVHRWPFQETSGL